MCQTRVGKIGLFATPFGVVMKGLSDIKLLKKVSSGQPLAKTIMYTIITKVSTVSGLST